MQPCFYATTQHASAGDIVRKATLSRPTSVYVSYTPADMRSQTAAEYICTALLQTYGVPCSMLGVDDGTLTFIDFDELLKVRNSVWGAHGLRPAI
jgi:hypothetical protein